MQFNKYRKIDYKEKEINFYVDEKREHDDISMLLEDLVEVLGYNENKVIEKLLNKKYLLDYVYQGKLNEKNKIFVGRYAIENIIFDNCLDMEFKEIADLAFNVYRSLNIYDSLKKEYEQIIENLSDSPVYKHHLYSNENRDPENERLLFTD